MSDSTAAVRMAGEDVSRTENVSLTTVLAIEAAYFGTSMLVLQNTWYRGRKRVPLHFYDDNRGYLQVDKFGHAFGAYVQSYVGYHLMRDAGLSERDALLFGGTLGILMQTPIEIMDGIHEGWGFSWGDMLANTLGSGLVLGQQLLFHEQVAVAKFSYRESEESRRANGFLGESALDRVLKDYNAHTYWLSVPLTSLVGGSDLPPWLCVSLGYGAKGMYGEYENQREYHGVTLPEARRARQFVLSLDVDWRKIETTSPVLNTILTALTFVKLPFPALELSAPGGLRGHALYF